MGVKKKENLGNKVIPREEATSVGGKKNTRKRDSANEQKKECVGGQGLIRGREPKLKPRKTDLLIMKANTFRDKRLTKKKKHEVCESNR